MFGDVRLRVIFLYPYPRLLQVKNQECSSTSITAIVNPISKILNWSIVAVVFLWKFFSTMNECQNEYVLALFMTVRFTNLITILNYIYWSHTAFQRFASTNAKHYVFCITDTKNVLPAAYTLDWISAQSKIDGAHDL